MDVHIFYNIMTQQGNIFELGQNHTLFNGTYTCHRGLKDYHVTVVIHIHLDPYIGLLSIYIHEIKKS